MGHEPIEQQRAQTTNDKYDAPRSVPERTGKQPSEPANSQAANAASEVLTKWWVNYHSLVGKKKEMPTRTQMDQLIVDQLKIQPDGEMPTLLAGGNAAKSGSVHVGDARVMRGAGTVAAALRYAKRSSLKVKLTFAAGTKAGEKRAAQQAAEQLVSKELQVSGDYNQMDDRVHPQLTAQFPFVTSVEIDPDAGGASDGIAAIEAPYLANNDPSSFEVTIDPSSTKERSANWSETKSDEAGSGQKSTVATKETESRADKQRLSEVHEWVEKFQETASENVQRGFKSIQNQLDAADSKQSAEHREETHWSLGVGGPTQSSPAGGGNASKPAKGKKSGGLASRAWNAVKDGAGWVYRSAKKVGGLVKKAPIISTAIDIVGTAWDKVVSTAKLERKGIEIDSKTTGSGQSHTSSSGTEITSLDSIAKSLTQELVKSYRSEIETELSTTLGFEDVETTEADNTQKESVSRTKSGTSITYEASEPRVTVRKLK